MPTTPDSGKKTERKHYAQEFSVILKITSCNNLLFSKRAIEPRQDNVVSQGVIFSTTILADTSFLFTILGSAHVFFIG